MRFALVSLATISIAVSAPLHAGAQQTLQVDVLERYEDFALQRDGIGCFDVLAAMRLQSEIGGRFSDETRQAFASGSCVVAASDVNLADAQLVEIANARFIRGAEPTSNVRLYFPEELINREYGGVGVTPLIELAADLRDRVNAREKCAVERDDLDARIVDFNARVDAFLAAQSDETPETGSRLKESKSATVTSIRLSSIENDELRRESLALKSEADAHEERCGAYREGLVLDQDYMPYYRATRGAGS